MGLRPQLVKTSSKRGWGMPRLVEKGSPSLVQAFYVPSFTCPSHPTHTWSPPSSHTAPLKNSLPFPSLPFPSCCCHFSFLPLSTHLHVLLILIYSLRFVFHLILMWHRVNERCMNEVRSHLNEINLEDKMIKIGYYPYQPDVP